VESVEARKMIADSCRAVARESRSARDGAVKSKDFANTVLRDGSLERKLELVWERKYDVTKAAIRSHRYHSR
jgi:hypothetical protein